jgi:hypothetical protein
MAESEMNSDLPANEPESVTGDVINLTNTQVKCVEAEVARLNQCTINQVTAEAVDFNNGAIQTVNSQNLTFQNGAVLVAHSNVLNFSDGGIGVASSQESTVNGNIGVLVTQTATVNEGQTGLIVAREIRGEKIKAVIMLAGETHGNVETIVDQRGIALFGLAVGIAMSLVFSLFRILKRS